MFEEIIKEKLEKVAEDSVKRSTEPILQEINDIKEGVEIVVDALSEMPKKIKTEVSKIDEKLSKEIKSVKDIVKTIKEVKGRDGKDAVVDYELIFSKIPPPEKPPTQTLEKLAENINKLEGIIDWKVLKNFDSLVNQTNLKDAIKTLENQVRYLLQINRPSFQGVSISLTGINSVLSSPSPITNTGTVQLVNDLANPGNNKLYGTNNSGVRGWFDIPLTYETITYAQAVILKNNNQITPGKAYLITDRADNGLFIWGITTNEFSLNGIGLFLNPDFQGIADYSGIPTFSGANQGVWSILNEINNPYQNGDVCYWDGNIYEVIDDTQLFGVPPDIATWAYQPYSKSLITGFVEEADFIEFDFENDWIQKRIDKRGNQIGMSFIQGNALLLGYNPVNVFQWGNDKIYGNKAQNSVLNIINATFLSPCFNLDFSEGSLFLGNTFNGNLNSIKSFRSNIDATFSLNCSFSASEFSNSILNISFAEGEINKTFFLNSKINLAQMTSSCSIKDSIINTSQNQNWSNFAGKIEKSSIIGGSEFLVTINGEIINSNISGNSFINFQNITQGRIINNEIVSTIIDVVGAVKADFLSCNFFQAEINGGSSTHNGTLTKVTMNGGKIDLTGFGNSVLFDTEIGCGINLTILDNVQITNSIIKSSEAVVIPSGYVADNKTLVPGFSSFEIEIDITNQTELILTGLNFIGKVYLTSSNASEVLDKIIDAPTKHNFILTTRIPSALSSLSVAFSSASPSGATLDEIVLLTSSSGAINSYSVDVADEIIFRRPDANSANLEILETRY